MIEQEKLDFIRIAEAVTYIKENFRSRPGLDEIAGKVGLSSFHFQRLFTDHAGVSPKNFLQFVGVEHAKKTLREGSGGLTDVAFETGRLHDLFVTIEGMTPGEYKKGGAHLVINYNFYDSIFGEVITASTAKGICYMAFIDDEKNGFESLKEQFPNAVYCRRSDDLHKKALSCLVPGNENPEKVILHLKGSNFRLKVWNALLKISSGNIATYGEVAAYTNNLKGSRAVGTAIGKNPVAYLIPCHRVILASGDVGNYRWGTARKRAMIGYESIAEDILSYIR